MRTRFGTAMALAMAMAGCASGAGSRTDAPGAYTSTAIVGVRVLLVISDNDGLGEHPHYDGYAKWMEKLVASDGVVSAAGLNPAWGESGLRRPADPGAYYARHLLVEVQHDGKVWLTVRDNDPKRAAFASKAIALALKADDDRAEKQRIDMLVKVLQEVKEKLQQQAAAPVPVATPVGGSDGTSGERALLNERILETTQRLEALAPESTGSRMWIIAEGGPRPE